MMSQLVRVATSIPRALSCKSIEYYTPKPFIDAAREVMGSIDCDPASNVLANQLIRASIYYTKETNGIDKPWHGNVWLNPPYGKEGSRANQARWSQRLIEQYQAGITKQAILLVTGAVETRWFQILLDYPICLPSGRIQFYTPEGGESGATCASALVYLGPHEETFIRVFRKFGRVIRGVDRPEYPLWEMA
jgi:hypothetical protein